MVRIIKFPQIHLPRDTYKTTIKLRRQVREKTRALFVLHTENDWLCVDDNVQVCFGFYFTNANFDPIIKIVSKSNTYNGRIRQRGPKRGRDRDRQVCLFLYEMVIYGIITLLSNKKAFAIRRYKSVYNICMAISNVSL